ncbi:MAG: large conductance mechanosensitive channel protein MscL [Clostridiales bacterium]|jgi:large conductance mechanosensitive channel|nr:large conductance mechanosensitive channel protein MscL [Clostridiales bacterium]
MALKEKKKVKTLSEFSNFILRGNVIDLAVGVIIGGAFNKIVSSFVGDIVTPVLSVFSDTVSFDSLVVPLAFLNADPTPTINIGIFISTVIDFIIMGFIVFCMVKLLNNIRKRSDALLKGKAGEEETEAPTVKDCPYCFSSINIKATKCPNCTSQLE